MVDILVAPTRVLIFSLTIIFKIVYDIFLEVYWFCRSTYSILQETMSNTKIGLSNPDNKLNKAKKPQHYFKKRKNTKKMNISKPEASNPELASIGHRQVSGSDNWKKFLSINSASNTVTHVQKPKQQNICSMRPKSQSQEQNYSKLSDKSNARGKLSNVNINPGDNYSYRPKKNLSETVVSEKSNKSLYIKKLTHKTEGTTNLSDASLFNKQANSKPNSEEDRANMSKDDGLKLTKQIAIDCEMVGVEVGVRNDMLARVSLVNAEGDCVYDKFVKPTEPVLDYRTRVSGVRPKDLENAADFKIVQKEVADILKGRVLVGHALKNDLKVLFLTHPKYLMRDTSKFRKFREGRTPSLKNLAKKYLGVDIQEGEHSSVQDALAAMQLYKMFRKEWESTIRTRKPQQDVKGPSSKFVPNGL